MQKYVISILVKNHSGVLRRVSSLFSRRGYNIESISCGMTKDADISRLTVVVNCDEQILDQIIKQVNKLIEVIKVEQLHRATSVQRELMLVKVKTSPSVRSELLEICKIYDAKVVDACTNSLILEVCGDNGKITSFIEMLTPYTVLETVRTGLTALIRGEEPFRPRELNCI